MIRPLLVLFLAFSSLFARGQSDALSSADRDSLLARSQELRELAYTMHADSSPEQRFLACKLLIGELVEALKIPNSYQFSFDSIPGLLVKHSPDDRFRTLTWELHVDGNRYRHYGAIQHNATELTLTPLLDRGDVLGQNPETFLGGADKWVGYVVYDILPAGTYQGQQAYFLLGFDRYAKWSRRKILDVLSFDDEGKPIFGAPIFKTYNADGLLLADRKRLIFEYGAEVNFTLDYDAKEQQIIFENLVMMPSIHDAKPILVPDGSYHALRQNDSGIWEETERVYTHKYEEAPREAAKPSAERDLFGREKNR